MTISIKTLVDGWVELLRKSIFDDHEAVAVTADNEFTTDNGVPVADGTGRKIKLSPVIIDADGNLTQVETISLKNDVTPQPAWEEGLMFYDTVNKCISFYNDEPEILLQIGQELFMRVYNDNGVAIENGQPCSVSGITAGGVPEVSLSDATLKQSAQAYVGLATHRIEVGTYGYVTMFGFVRDFDTSHLVAGAPVWLDPAAPGLLTSVEPESPAWLVRVGGCPVSDEFIGQVFSRPQISNNTEDTRQFFNGGLLEPATLTVSSDTVTCTVSIEKTSNPAEPLSLLFTEEFHITPAPHTATLVAGTDLVPVRNWVYFPESTKVLTVSTSGFPTSEQFVPVADIIVQSPLTASQDGFYKVHAWTDHFSGSNRQGHLSHINEWIRNRPAAWISGCVLTPSLAEGASAAELDLQYTSGVVYQLHKHGTPVFDSALGDPFFVQNDPTVAYRRIESINATDITVDTEGGSLNNKSYSLVIWAVVSQDDDDCQTYINLPTGSYTTETGAIADASATASYSLPAEFTGTAYLLSRIVVKNQGGNVKLINGGVFDLRGTVPSATGGGVSGGAGVVNFTELLDTPSSYTGEAHKISRVNTGETALEFTGAYIDTDIGEVALRLDDGLGAVSLTNSAGGGILEANNTFDFRAQSTYVASMHSTGLTVNSPLAAAYPLDVYGDSRFRGHITVDEDITTNGDIFVVATADALISLNTPDGNATINNSSGYLWVNSPEYIDFRISNAVKIFVGSSGVTINSAFDPNFPLDVYGDINTVGGTYRIDGVDIFSSIYWTASGNDIYNKNTGNVGIGTTAPVVPLHVLGTGSNVALIRSTGSQARLVFHNSVTTLYSTYLNCNNTAFTTVVGGSERMRITDTGNVGIGTTSPSYLLDVRGNPQFYNEVGGIVLRLRGNTDIAYVDYRDSAGVRRGYSGYGSTTPDYFINNESNGNIRLYTDATERMRITNVGNVGIGTTSPADKLHLNNGISTTQLLIDGVTAQQIRIQANANANSYFYNYGTGGMYWSNINASEHGWSTSNTRRMTLSAAGNLGIGTTSPLSPLHVYGTATVDGASSGQINYRAGGTLYAYQQVTSTNWILESQVAGFRLRANHASGYIRFDTGTSNAERMRITSAGNVGIGQTLPQHLLHVGDNGVSVNQEIRLERTALDEGIISIAYDDSNIGLRLRVTDAPLPAASIEWDGSATPQDEPLYFHSLNNGTHMTILSDGKVGIGQVTPTSLLTIGNHFVEDDKWIEFRKHLSQTSGIRWKVDATADEDDAYISVDETEHLNIGYNQRNTPLNSDLRFFSGATQVMTLTDAGKVGVGTTSPTTLFEVDGTFASAGIFDSCGSGNNRLTVTETGCTFEVPLGTYEVDVRGNLTTEELNIENGTAPATASSTGTKGDVAYDSNYIYICTATNTWKRAALSTW